MASERKLTGEPQRIQRPDFVLAGSSTATAARDGGRPGSGGGTGAGTAREDGFRHALGVLRASSRRSYLTV